VVLYETRGHVATVTMNRPDVANAQDTALIDGIDACLDRADADDEVRVVVLAGNGKHFSSGHDLKALVGDTEPDEWRRMRDTPEGKFRHEQVMYFERCQRIYHFRKPTIAAVQGACVAAGLMLACMCDLIVASDDATFQNPVLRMTGAGVELLVEPWELGLVNKVVPRAELTDRVDELADRVALVPPTTAQVVKDSLNNTATLMGKEASWKYHFMAHHWMHNTETATSALKARQAKTSMSEVFAEHRD